MSRAPGEGSGAGEARAVFSVDVEDWYHGIGLTPDQWRDKEDRLSIGLERILSLLEEHRTQATFFVLGCVAASHPEAVRLIARAGHELASHGYSHTKVYDLTPKAFREEIRTTKRLLEDLSGSAVTAHRSPYFSITQASLWALPILRQEGFEVDCSISPVETWRYGIRGSPSRPYLIQGLGLVEFPVSTFNFLAGRMGIGGAYFRIFPYRWTEIGLGQAMRKHRAAMFYAHPWEFDPGHPVNAGMGFKARLTHYANLKGMLPRTARLLQNRRFGTLGRAVRALRAGGRLPAVDLAAFA